MRELFHAPTSALVVGRIVQRHQLDLLGIAAFVGQRQQLLGPRLVAKLARVEGEVVGRRSSMGSIRVNGWSSAFRKAKSSF